MKNKKGDAADVGHVWGASLVVDEIEQPGGPNTPTTPTTPVSALSCVDKKDHQKRYGAPSGGLYLIECGLDYAGGDLAASVVDSFEDCIETCDKNVLCVDVSYVSAGVCLYHD